MSTLIQCPGLYCGRELLLDGNWSDCGACMRGFRANASSACVSCEDTPTLYDWLYLGFMVLVVLVLHWFFINFLPFCDYSGEVNYSDTDKFGKIMIAHLSAFFEVSLACVIVLLLTEPIGTFSIKSCRTDKLSDWYTLLHNPSPNYEATLHCTQEAVYPLLAYTVVFFIYLVGVILMLLIRPRILRKFVKARGNFSLYGALYFYPLLTLLHAIGGGIIYYAFPFISIIVLLIFNAVHFAFKKNQTFKPMLVNTFFFNKKNTIVILGHWILNGYSIVAIATFCEIDIHPWMLILVPLPTVFYFLTANHTNPHKIHNDFYVSINRLYHHYPPY